MSRLRCGVVVLAIVLTVVSGCTPGGGVTPPTPPVSAPATPARSPSAVEPLVVPPPAAGELARAVDAGGSLESTQVATASGDQEYQLRFECRARRPTDRYTYSVTADGVALVSGELSCSGAILVNTVGPLAEGTRVSVQLDPPSLGGGEAYLIVVPATVA